MEGSATSRRTILRSGVLALGALAGVVGLAGIGERLRPTSTPAISASGLTTLTLHGRDWHLSAPGLRRGDLPKRGDRVSVSGVLSYAAGANPVGDFVASVIHTDGRGGHGPYAAVQLETHTFQLPEGTLIGVGTTASEGANVFAIVGGTGQFLGTTGSYTATQNPFETGGDGTAEFTMTLKSGR